MFSKDTKESFVFRESFELLWWRLIFFRKDLSQKKLEKKSFEFSLDLLVNLFANERNLRSILSANYYLQGIREMWNNISLSLGCSLLCAFSNLEPISNTNNVIIVIAIKFKARHEKVMLLDREIHHHGKHLFLSFLIKDYFLFFIFHPSISHSWVCPAVLRNF